MIYILGPLVMLGGHWAFEGYSTRNGWEMALGMLVAGIALAFLQKLMDDR